MTEVVDVAVGGGVNYIDAFSDPGSHTFSDYVDAIAPAVREHRANLVLCLHWGGLYREPIDQCEKGFVEALDRLGGGYADVAMVHIVDTEEVWKEWALPAIERISRYKSDGLVGSVGFANHVADVALTAVRSGLIDVLMLPVNLYQYPRRPRNLALLEAAHEAKLGVVAMKPYMGGRLLMSNGRKTGITPTQCLHYVLSQPVHTAIPGARNATEMAEAVAYADATPREREFGAVGDELQASLKGQCLQCGHCLPCPQEINIPSVILNLEYVEYYSGSEFSETFNRGLYAKRPAKASDCTECEVCLERCPFGVDIIGKMRRAEVVLETG
jgi:predicted aldo/keto reductase-like oxidoreductase